MRSIAMLIGRWCMAVIFLVSAVQKIFTWKATSAMMEAKDMEMVPVFLMAALLIELFGGLSLLVGAKVRICALILAIYLIPVTLLFHDFWMLPAGEVHDIQLFMFLKNLAIIGGLIYVTASGAGRFSRDHHKALAQEGDEKEGEG